MFFNCDDFFSVFKVKIPNTQYLYIKHTNNKHITQKTVFPGIVSNHLLKSLKKIELKGHVVGNVDDL